MTLALGGPAAAQTTTGGVEGVVRDGAGGALAGVSVEASSPSLPGIRRATTDAAGRFRLPTLPPGAYRVRAVRPGFRAAEKTASVALGATARVDLDLEPAAEASVVVSGVASSIDPATTTGGTSYDARVVAHLPTGRNYSDIVQANPGVSTDRGDTQGRSLALTIYGATSAENQWIVDGVDTTNVYKGIQGKAFATEFVQEVEVKTGGYQAQYGGALGGVINVVTKSGGNEYHADAFAYYDSNGTASHQVFLPGDSLINQMRVASGQRVDAGADLGGFLVKDRLWIFGAYDRVDFRGQVARVQASDYVSTADRFPLETTDDLFTAKLTWNAAPSTTVVASVFADPSTNSGAAGADPRQGVGDTYVTPITNLDPATWRSTRSLGGTDYALTLSQLLGSGASVSLQGGFHRDEDALSADQRVRVEDATCQGGTPDAPCTRIAAPTAYFGYGGIVGVTDHAVSQRALGRAEGTFYAGNHQIQGGAGYADAQTTTHGSATGGQQVTILNPYGTTYYQHDFIAASVQDLTPVANAVRHVDIRSYSAYAQDSWKAGPGLTINAGLRWDGQQTRSQYGGTVLGLYDGWQPRVGVTWDPWKNGATKIYGFVGRFDYALPTALVLNSFASITRLLTCNYSLTEVTPQPPILGCEQNPNVLVAPYGDVVDSGLSPGYQDELTLGVERLVAPGLTVGLKGTYRRLGNVIEDRCDFDYSIVGTSCALVNPGSTATYARGDAPVCDGFDVDGRCTASGPPTPAASRIYRGIELVARQSFSTDLWLQASYVYSSLRGNYDGGVNQATYGQTFPGYSSAFDYPALWHDASGTLALDRTHRLRLDGFWVTPWKLWIGLQAFVETGAPLDRLGYFDQNYGSLVFLVPRGSAGRLPTLWEGNLSLGYPMTLGPVTVTLQAYLYNLFNNQIATSTDEEWSIGPAVGYPATVFDPNQQPMNPDYGKVTARSAPRSFRAAVRVTF